MELAKQRLLYMQKDDARRDHKDMFDEWQQIQGNIWSLRRNLNKVFMSKNDPNKLKEDIMGLSKHKNKLAKELGLK